MGLSLLVRRGSDLARVAEVDDFTKLEVQLRFNDISTWALDLPTASTAGRLLREDGAGLVVERDGQVIISGPVAQLERRRDAGVDRLTVAGVDDLVQLRRRLALPSPDGIHTAQAYDVRQGPAETVLHGYVDANAGPGALAARQVAGLTLAADGGRGTQVTGRARFTPLLEVARELALAGGDIGFRIIDGDGVLRWEVYEPADRSATAVFAEELGNLAGFALRVTAPTATFAYVAGQGEGELRTIVEVDDAAVDDRWDRSETLIDQRNTDDVDELTQAGAEALIEAAAATSLSLTPLDTDAVAYLADYQLGDRVTVEVDGQPLTETIRSLRLTYDADGETVVPDVSSPGDATLLRLFDRLRRVDRRVGQLERNR